VGAGEVIWRRGEAGDGDGDSAKGVGAGEFGGVRETVGVLLELTSRPQDGQKRAFSGIEEEQEMQSM